MYRDLRVAVVVPAYNEERHIADVVATMPAWVDHLLIIDDASPDRTAERARAAATEVTEVISLPANKGVGGAILTGHRRALDLDADVCVVMAGDGQMDPDYLPALLDPIASGEAEFTKANRFFGVGSFDGMPRHRVFGNVVLSFLTKAASGYWNLFDPQNGYTAVHRSALLRLPLERIAERYDFENDLLINLNIVRARARDVPIPARYGDEVSGMRLTTVAPRLLRTLFRGFWHRIWWKYVLQSFSPVALLLFAGLLCLAFSTAVSGFVLINTLGPPVASPGTVLLAVAPMLTAIHLLISAMMLDIQEGSR